MSPIGEIARELANSMQTEPGKWKPYYIGERPYKVTHSQTGVEVWMANAHYGLSIGLGDIEIGGLTALSAFLGWATPWRRELLAEARKIAPVRPDLGPYGKIKSAL